MLIWSANTETLVNFKFFKKSNDTFLTHFLMLIMNLTTEIKNESGKVSFFTFFDKPEIDHGFSIGTGLDYPA
jgi:hypothetical protein